MKRFALVSALLLGTTGIALANDQYHVYKKKDANKCEIDTRDHDKFSSARGSGWMCIGHANYRMDAEKIQKQTKVSGPAFANHREVTILARCGRTVVVSSRSPPSRARS